MPPSPPLNTFWAHSDPEGLSPDHPRSRWQLLSVHLRNVGALAARLASEAAPADFDFHSAAEAAGLLHDLGKYTRCFQRRIRTGQGRCPHAAHGAYIANQHGRPDASFAIVGHHSGIPDEGGEGSWRLRITDAKQEAEVIQKVACEDQPALLPYVDRRAGPLVMNPAHFDLRTRLLFSCLVDADRLDSGGENSASPPLLARDRLAKLLQRLKQLQSAAGASVVTTARTQVLADCLSAAHFPERLLSLSVPTGGGKTLAAMAFALKRVELNPDHYRRVIVVIPYLSIIEQNAEVYSQIFGSDAILEHHSGAFDRLRESQTAEKHFIPASSEQDEFQDDVSGRRTATENWSEPMIVTTSVRFFESLFSNRPVTSGASTTSLALS